MTEAITIDGLPEGYTVSSANSKSYHYLFGPNGHAIFRVSKRYKQATIEKKLIDEAERHAALMYAGHRANAEKVFCKDFTNEQLEAVSLKEMHEAMKAFYATDLSTNRTEVFWHAKHILDKLEAQEAQS